MTVGPLQLAFYKGITGKFGAIQFNPQLPHYYVKTDSRLKNFEDRSIKPEWLEKNPTLSESDLASREGAIFLEITSAKDKNVYDWAKKIIFALSITDIAKFSEVLEGKLAEAKLMHDPGAKSERQGKVRKHLEVVNNGEKGCMVTASEVVAGGSSPTRHTVPLSTDECLALSEAMRAFISKALGWI